MKLVAEEDGREIPIPCSRLDRDGRSCRIEAIVREHPGTPRNMVLISRADSGAHKVFPETINARIEPYAAG